MIELGLDHDLCARPISLPLFYPRIVVSSLQSEGRLRVRHLLPFFFFPPNQ